MRRLASFSLLLLLAACGDKAEPDNDSGSGAEADADTDTDTDADADADTDADTDTDTDADTDTPTECDIDGCGGDLIGSWTITGGCADAALGSIEFCPDAEIEATAYTVSGTMTFDGDGDFTSSVTRDITLETTITADCLAASGAADCAGLSDIIPVTCTANGDDCDCVLSDAGTEQTNGTWTASGSTLTLIDGDDEESGAFCVDGDTLQLNVVDPLGVKLRLDASR